MQTKNSSEHFQTVLCHLWWGYLLGYMPASFPDGPMLFCPPGGAMPPSGPITWSGLQDTRRQHFYSKSKEEDEGERRRKRRRIKRVRGRRRRRKRRRTSLYAQNTNTTIMYKFCPDLMSDQFTSARSRARRGTGAWGPSLSGAQRAARGGTCPAWHRQASDQDQRPHRAPDLKKNKK